MSTFEGIDKPLLVGPQILSEELAQLADELHRQGRDAHVQKKLLEAALRLEELKAEHFRASMIETGDSYET